MLEGDALALEKSLRLQGNNSYFLNFKLLPYQSEGSSWGLILMRFNPKPYTLLSGRGSVPSFGVEISRLMCPGLRCCMLRTTH